MKLRRPIAKAALVLAVLLAVGMAIPATLAYITAHTDKIVNIFRPDYTQTADAFVDVTVHKTVTNLCEPAIGPEGFTFLITDTATEKAVSIVSDKDGNARAVLTYTKDDANKTFTYRISEVNDKRENMVYDAKVYTVHVSLKLNSNAQLVPTVIVDGLQVDQVNVKFTNVHTTEVLPPDTGDDSIPVLYGIMMVLGLTGLAVTVISRRKRMA